RASRTDSCGCRSGANRSRRRGRSWRRGYNEGTKARTGPEVRFMSESRLAHNVFFKLRDAAPDKVGELVEACRKYLNVQPGIVFFAAGPICRELDRDVNDRDWD